MKRQKKLAIALALFGMGGTFATAFALAETASDRAVAEQIVSELSGLPEGERAAATGPLQHAEKALERASSARGGGDTRAGELLEGVAREWAETARDVLRASRAEADAGALQAEAADAAVQAERARALLEEAITRRGRAEAELRNLQAEAEKEPSPPAKAKPKGGRR